MPSPHVAVPQSPNAMWGTCIRKTAPTPPLGHIVGLTANSIQPFPFAEFQSSPSSSLCLCVAFPDGPSGPGPHSTLTICPLLLVTLSELDFSFSCHRRPRHHQPPFSVLSSFSPTFSLSRSFLSLCLLSTFFAE